MRKYHTWSREQLYTAIYAFLYGEQDLGYAHSDLLRLLGLTEGQWSTRVHLDMPAQAGNSPYMKPIQKWRDVWLEASSLPKVELRSRVLAYLGELERSG